MKTNGDSSIRGKTGRSIKLNSEAKYVDLQELLAVIAPHQALIAYDPGFRNSAHCKSAISSIDPELGILRYRGYDVSELSEHCGYLEVAYLLLKGDLPAKEELTKWISELQGATRSGAVIGIKKTLQQGERLVALFVANIAAMSPYESSQSSHNNTWHDICSLIGGLPTLATTICTPERLLRRSQADLSYAGQLLGLSQKNLHQGDAANVEKAINKLLILLADHEQNCSTTVMRAVASAGTNPYLCVAAAICAASGAHHGGASVSVLQMLLNIGEPCRAPEYIHQVKLGRAPLFGFGHSVYKQYDPRATILKRLSKQFALTNEEKQLLNTAMELESALTADEFFRSKQLFPTVELYSAVLCRAIGFPPEVFPIIFAIARTSGWLAHWCEMQKDPDHKAIRPRQIYTGHRARSLGHDRTKTQC